MLFSSRNSEEGLLSHSHSPSHPSPPIYTISNTQTLQCSIVGCRYSTSTNAAAAGPGNAQKVVNQAGVCLIVGAKHKTSTTSAAVGHRYTQGAANQGEDRRATGARAQTHSRPRLSSNFRRGHLEDTSSSRRQLNNRHIEASNKAVAKQSWSQPSSNG